MQNPTANEATETTAKMIKPGPMPPMPPPLPDPQQEQIDLALRAIQFGLDILRRHTEPRHYFNQGETLKP